MKFEESNINTLASIQQYSENQDLTDTSNLYKYNYILTPLVIGLIILSILLLFNGLRAIMLLNSILISKKPVSKEINLLFPIIPRKINYSISTSVKKSIGGSSNQGKLEPAKDE